MAGTFAIELPWWAVPFLFGLQLLLAILTITLAVITYRLLKKTPRKPAHLAMLALLWTILLAAYLYFRRVF